MRTYSHCARRTFVKLGAALGALGHRLPGRGRRGRPTAPRTPAPGGLGYDDPEAPSVFADGSTLLGPARQLLGDDVRCTARSPAPARATASSLQRLDPDAGWQPAATATVGRRRVVRRHLEARPQRRARSCAPSCRPARRRPPPTAGPAAVDGRDVTVFRRARATWYGPGFYGRRTACGLRLTTRTLGVAHRTLPCGTLVELFKDGRTVTVPVIDRGPFRPGTSYDLTYATAQRARHARDHDARRRPRPRRPPPRRRQSQRARPRRGRRTCPRRPGPASASRSRRRSGHTARPTEAVSGAPPSWARAIASATRSPRSRAAPRRGPGWSATSGRAARARRGRPAPARR